MRTAGRLLRASLCACALLAAPLPAAAQGGDKAAAESLFQAGRELMGQKRFAEACPKFAESAKLDPSAGTSLNLGQCYEGLGKTASAWAEYKAAAALAHTQGRAQQEQAANELAAALQPKLSKLSLELGADAQAVPALVVRRDGAEVGRGSLGIGIAIDPGEHTITATAPGYKDWSAKVVVGAERDAKTVVVTGLVKDASAAAAPPPATPAGPATAPPPAPASGGSTMRTAGFVVGGLGLVGLGVGGLLGGLAMSQASSAKDDPTLCPDKVCTPAGRAEIDGASGKALGSTIGFVAGGVLLATGVVLVVVGGPSKKEASAGARTAVVPMAGPEAGGLAVLGTF